MVWRLIQIERKCSSVRHRRRRYASRVVVAVTVVVDTACPVRSSYCIRLCATSYFPRIDFRVLRIHTSESDAYRVKKRKGG